MINYKDCPLCWQRKIHASLNACEQCEWAASFARDADKAHKELALVKAERDQARAEVERLLNLLGRQNPVRCTECGEIREADEQLCGNCGGEL